MPSWVIRGAGGRLRCGARPVASLGKWEAVANGTPGHFRLTVRDAERDPIGWDNHDPSRLVAELRLKTTDWRGRASIVSADPLVLDIWREDE